MDFLKCVGYLALIGVLAHFFGEALPRRLFDGARFPWRAARWERGGRIYDRLHIRRWKDKLPDMSRFMPDMVRKEVPAHATPEQIDEQIKETCVAELTHAALSLCGFLCVYLWRGPGGVIISLLFAVGNVPFILIQRYNRPRLLRLRGWLAARQEERRRAEPDAVGLCRTNE